ncbi:unnamed protein product [Cercopithifilaria johnstoni]|uniref:EGF-like domain-containing protein n=1 Tax=Cercopithifilaria johnstoni TaxID=2874296 RepID=A0A8J2M347_9BILA|nr:unnamed protein product [Cercopithifilaria johnstoni]
MYSSSTRWNMLAQQRKAFVNPQSECRIKCLNGGFCAYLVDNPSIHTCLCLLNVYYGDRCQYAVTETTTLATDSTERPRLHHSGREQFEIGHQRYEVSSPIQTEKISSDEITKYDEISQFGYTKVYQVKEPKRITSTEEIKTDENDYTEGWDTTIGDDDEYSYDDRATDPLDTVRSEPSMPVWLQESDDYRTVTGQGNPQRIYLNKKKTDQMVTRVDKDKRMKTDEETLAKWTIENDNSDSQELMAESESMDEGWMISKRRRVITNSAAVITNTSLKSTFFLIFFVMPLLRW